MDFSTEDSGSEDAWAWVGASFGAAAFGGAADRDVDGEGFAGGWDCWRRGEGWADIAGDESLGSSKLVEPNLTEG